MIYLLFALFLCFSSQLPSLDFEIIPNEAILPLLNPSYHDQKTEKIKLPNGLQAVLVSDPTTKQSAITMTVMAGSWLEPDEFPGLAHFLEHMLFMGTAEYPDESSFTRFLTEHGGQTNAYTHGDYTSFMFALNNDGFVEGLKRFSSFFKEPLFNPSGVQRELNAIDQEFAQGFNNQDVREFFVLKQLASPLHPFSRFQTGNSQSLARATTADLKKWFEGHYSANLMKLYVLSSEPIDEIRKLVIQDFSGIPNRKLQAYQRSTGLFTKEILGHLVRIEPKNAAQTLTLVWELPSELSPLLESRPADLICASLGYEGKNSLLSLLKSDGLADSLSCGTTDLSSITNLFNIEIKLTSKGISELDTVIEMTFSALHLIAENPYPEYLFEDYAGMLKQRYQFQQRDEPFEWAMDQASQLASEPIGTYPELSKTLRIFDLAAIKAVSNILTPQNAIFILTAPGQKLKKKETWMQIAYDVESIPETKLNAWLKVKPNPDIQLPPKNPFLAKSPKATTPLIEKDTFPAVAPPTPILDTSGGKIYYSQDPFYQVPRTSFILQIQTPEIKDAKPTSVVMADMYVKVLKENLQDLIDEALMADMEVSIERTAGSIQISVEGFTESLIAFFPELIPHLTHLEFTPQKFDQIKDNLRRDYENNLTSSPIKQVFDRFKALIFEQYTNFNQKRSAINKITFLEFQNFQKNLFNKTYLKGAIVGSLTVDEAKKLVSSLNQAFHASPTSDALPYYPKIKPFDLAEGPLIYNFTSKAEGDALFLGMGVDGFTPNLRNAQELLSQAMSEAYFAELRTKQQTGYIVFSEALDVQKYLISFFGVQSTTHTPLELLYRSELFIANYLNDLETNISKERFEGLKSSLAKQLKTPPATLKLFGEQNFKLGFEIEDFGWMVKRLDDLSHLTYEEFIKTSRAFLSRENKRRLAIALKGQFRGTPPFEYNAYKKKKKQ